MGDILFLAHRIPFPPDKGDKIRSWNILRHLATRERVHLCCFVDDEADMVHADRLRRLCASVALVPLDPRTKWRRALAGLWNNQPISLAVYHDDRLHAHVQSLLRQHDIDRIFGYSGQIAPYALPHVTGARRFVMDFVDIDSDKWAQYARSAAPLRRMVFEREAKLLAAFEKQVARVAHVSLFVSSAEAAMFKRIAGSYGHEVMALRNGVDLDYFDPREVLPADPHPPTLAFTGAMDYRPNVDAVLWFVREVWPAIRARVPEGRFAIVGSAPVPAVKALHDKDGVTVTGRVPDVRPYLAGADIVVAPLRIARGVQNKVLEAMAMGRAVLCTPAALEGIEAEPGRDLTVAETAAAFASEAVALLADPARRAQMGLAARAQMVAHYGWDASLAQLDVLLHLPSRPAQARFGTA